MGLVLYRKIIKMRYFKILCIQKNTNLNTFFNDLPDGVYWVTDIQVIKGIERINNRTKLSGTIIETNGLNKELLFSRLKDYISNFRWEEIRIPVHLTVQ